MLAKTRNVLLPDATLEQQLCGVIANQRRWFVAQSIAAGGEARPIPGGGTLTIAPDEVVLAFPRIATLAMPGYLDGVLALCHERRPQRASCWARDARGHGAIGARLAARGFEWGWQANWMALDLRAVNSDFPTPPGLHIAVDDHADWDVEDLPYYDAQGMRKLRALIAVKPRRVWHFGAWLDGKLVGHSILFLSTGHLGVGGIYNVGVIPSARNQGVGRAVTLAACRAAQQSGYHYVTLNAATHIYDHIGFQSLGRGQTWWLHANAMLNPPSSLEITFAEAIGMGDIATLNALASLPDLEAPLACGQTPIQLAVRAGKLNSVKCLVSRGAVLHIIPALDLGWKEEAARLLAENPELANHRSGHIQSTPMHEAVYRNDAELARLLLTARPDLTIADAEFNSTPLGWARHFNRIDLVALMENN